MLATGYCAVATEDAATPVGFINGVNILPTRSAGASGSSA
ncbi:hypothetical protein BN135_3228 [Cronobacter muytjensii 530]